MKKKKKEKAQRRRILFISAAVLLSAGLWTLGTAQVKIGGDPTTPVTTRAVLELDGASGGLLLPRVAVLPPAASASEGTMYYQISDGTVYIFLIDGGKHWEPVGSGSPISGDIAAKAKKLAYGIDSAKLAGIAAGANFVLVENILTSTATMNALSAAQGRALLDSIRNRSSQGSNTLNAFRDSVYKKPQTLAGSKTFSDAAIFSNNVTVNGATASFPNATAVTFPNANPTVKAKSAAAVLGNTTQLATEAQVALAQNTAGNALNAFRDSVYTKAQTLGGDKTFSGTNTFTVSPTVPSKSSAAGANATLVATEAQVFAVASAVAGSALNAFRDSVYAKNMNIGGNKTFTGTITMDVPQLPTSTTAKTFFAAPTATNGRPTFRPIVFEDLPEIKRASKLASGTADSTALANLNAFKTTTESNAQTLGGVKTFSAAPVVPAKSAALTVATGTTALATEAQIYNTAVNTKPTALIAHIDSIYNRNMPLGGIKTFTSAPVVPAKANSGGSTTALATDAAVNAVRDSLLTKPQVLAGNKTFSNNVIVTRTTTHNGATTLAGTNTLSGATTVSGAAAFTSATATSFSTSPTVPAKTTAITVPTGTQAVATEAQVFNTVKALATNGFRDSIYNQPMSLSGHKTFSSGISTAGTNNINGTTTISGPTTMNGQTTFTTEPQVPVKLNAIYSDEIVCDVRRCKNFRTNAEVPCSKPVLCARRSDDGHRWHSHIPCADSRGYTNPESEHDWYCWLCFCVGTRC
ncbi:hypothetical protein AGMMS49525_03570 [Bacteroidia bacterium]|nr:hypothetical protein AGMMS49525_03570 [Bacteroidia bacterium]